MICIGEQSPLIFKDLGIAETCLKKIQHTVPIAEARLAYIELLQSNEPARSSANAARDVCSFIGVPGAMLDASHVNADVLYDFKTSANMQIRL